jgi:magnesium-protoporphyrin IX monomethyl ester (oxidative) cyclase
MQATLSDADHKASRAAVNETTEMATETTMLSPRFYTTDFDEMDRIDVTPVREEWDALLAEMKSHGRAGAGARARHARLASRVAVPVAHAVARGGSL